MAARRVSFRLARLTARYPCRRGFAATAARSAEQIRIVEVGPRDGLQNEKKSIPLETKLQLIERLAQTGLRTIEAGSFVSPKWVPQMANSSEILEHLLQHAPKSPHPITYQFLLPNEKGFDNFLSVYQKHATSSTSSSSSNGYPTPPPSPSDNGPALNTSSQDPNAMPSTPAPHLPPQPPHIELSIFTAATETFSRKNTNCSIAESLSRFRPLLARAKQHDATLNVRAYISVALGCPFEGPDVDPHRVADLAVSLLELGANEISIADTTGMGTPPRTAALLKALAAAGVEHADLALHFHDTYGQALVNTVVALEHGIRTFDAAVAGLGGCPYSPGATGNVSTEDLVYAFHALGAETGVRLEELARVGEWISRELGRPNESRAGKATLAKLARKDA